MGFLTISNVRHPTHPNLYIGGGEFGELACPISPQFGEFGELINWQPLSGTDGVRT